MEEAFAFLQVFDQIFAEVYSRKICNTLVFAKVNQKVLKFFSSREIFFP